MNRDIALEYQDKIFRLLHDNQWTEAEGLILDALDFDSELSGLWYSRGKIEAESMNYQEAMEYNSLALTLGQWAQASYRDSIILQLRLQNTLKKYEEMETLSRKIPELMRWDEDILWYRSLALYRLGRIEESLESAQLGRNLYPDDPRFFSILLHSPDPSLLQDFHILWGDQKEVVNRIFYPLLSTETEDRLKRYYLEQGEGYLRDYWALSSGDLPGIEDYLYHYTDLSDLVTLSRLYRLSDSESRILILDFMEQSDHSFQEDRNRDGIAESQLSKSSGFWSYWIDSDQNGVYETEAQIMEGKLRSLKVIDGKQIRYSYGYGNYLDQISVTTEWAKRDYFFPIGARRSSFPVYSNLMETLMGLREQTEDHSESDFMKAAERIEEHNGQGILFRTYFLIHGEVFLVREDSDLNGKEDRLFRVEKGKILAGIRDLNEDGLFDLYEYYHQGNWEGLMLDRQQDGVGDYLESWNPVEIKLWDYNQDDLWDSVFINEPFHTIIDPQRLGTIYKEDTQFWDFSYEKYWFH